MLVMRADATVELGTGHVMRLLGLAATAQTRGLKCWFILGNDVAMKEFIKSRGHYVSNVYAESASDGDVDQTTSVSDATAVGVVVDGYAFDNRYYHALRSRLGCVLAIVDDLAQVELTGDVLINPNYGADRLPYRAPASMRRLLGPRYAMLRPEIVTAKKPRAARAGEPTILVTLGGADHTGTTPRVLAALAGVKAKILLVLGAANPRADEIAKAAARDPRVEVLRAPPNMGDLMQRADAAISAAGQTLWELSYFGLSTLAFSVADNQLPAVEALGRDGLVVYGGRADALDDAAVAARVRGFLDRQAEWPALGTRFGALVDGKGAERVLDAILEVAKEKGR